MFRSFRYRLAFFFGRKEHFFARLLFVLLIITYISFHYGQYVWVEYMLLFDILIWLLYWICHRLEKASFPGNGVRR